MSDLKIFNLKQFKCLKENIEQNDIDEFIELFNDSTSIQFKYDIDLNSEIKISKNDILFKKMITRQAKDYLTRDNLLICSTTPCFWYRIDSKVVVIGIKTAFYLFNILNAFKIIKNKNLNIDTTSNKLQIESLKNNNISISNKIEEKFLGGEIFEFIKCIDKNKTFKHSIKIGTHIRVVNNVKFNFKCYLSDKIINAKYCRINEESIAYHNKNNNDRMLNNFSIAPNIFNYLIRSNYLKRII